MGRMKAAIRKHWDGLKRISSMKIRKIRADAVAAMNVREFAVFAVIVFFGLLVGNWITQILGISGGDMLSQLLVFLIPVLAVYVLWKKLGVSLAK